VLGIETTLRAASSGELVSVWTIVSFLFQDIKTACGAETSSCTTGTGVTSLGKAVGA
jgi:hypothetical protein